jgi:hypothetical protein
MKDMGREGGKRGRTFLIKCSREKEEGVEKEGKRGRTIVKYCRKGREEG